MPSVSPFCQLIWVFCALFRLSKSPSLVSWDHRKRRTRYYFKIMIVLFTGSKSHWILYSHVAPKHPNYFSFNSNLSHFKPVVHSSMWQNSLKTAACSMSINLCVGFFIQFYCCCLKSMRMSRCNCLSNEMTNPLIAIEMIDVCRWHWIVCIIECPL